MTKPIVIAGNGPSLAKIDYSRLPTDFDVYRCNLFYFEESYFLGKDITAVFFNPGVFFQQYYTLKQLIANKEYTCNHIYCSKMYWANELWNMNSTFSFLYPDAIEVYTLLQKHPDLHSFLKYNELYLQERITSGVLMAVVAAINGYKELYITGIDFYETEEYAFSHDKENLKQLVPGFKAHIKTGNHTKNIDIKTLQFLEHEFNIRIYSLSPQSSLSEFYPPPSKQQRTLAFHVEQKKKSCIQDILFPSVKNPLEPIQIQRKEKSWLKKEREQNLYIKIVEDFFRLFAFCIKGVRYLIRKK